MSPQTHQACVLAGRGDDANGARRAPRVRDRHGPAGGDGAGGERDAVRGSRLRRWRDRAALRR